MHVRSGVVELPDLHERVRDRLPGLGEYPPGEVRDLADAYVPSFYVSRLSTIIFSCDMSSMEPGIPPTP